MSKYFGTDGFRGEANKALNVEHAYKIGRFLGAYYGREHKCSVVIGKDTRRSGYMFECALTAGLTASGADAYLMHVTTTPSVSYITRTDDFDCGIMERSPNIFMMDDPTRGIDVGAKYEIYELIINMAKQGKTIIVVSSEMPEILGITNRIGVMSNGHLAGIVNTKETNQEELLRLSAKYL